MGRKRGDLPPLLAGEQPVIERMSAGPVVADTFAGRIHVEWDNSATVTPLGQLPFFIEFVKQGSLFDSWVADCPLHYRSPNAPNKRDVLGNGCSKDEIGGQHTVRRSTPGLCHGLLHPGGDLAKGSDIVLGITRGTKGMHHDKCLNEVDVRSVELLQWEGIVVIRLSINNRLQLPLHDIGGDALSVVHRGAI